MVFDAVQRPGTDLKFTEPIGFGAWSLEIFKKNAAQGKTALLWADNGKRISYVDLVKNIVKTAAGLQAMGVKPGDAMSFVTNNSPEVYYFVYGCMLVDVLVAPSFPDLNANELRQNFLLVKPQWILARPYNLPVVQEAINCDELDPKPKIIPLDDKTFKEILAKGDHAEPSTFQPIKIKDPETHVYAIFFSSGTTGKQKAIMITDYSFVRKKYSSSRALTRDNGLVLNPSQIYWMSWMMALSRSAIAGRPFIFMSTVGVEALTDAIHKHKPATLICLPSLVHAMVKTSEKQPGRWDLSSLKLIITVGDTMLPSLQKQLSKKLNVDIHQEYGSTEVGIVTQGDVDGKMVYGSAGKPLEAIKLVDPETEIEITEPFKTGEVRVETSIMAGYYGEPEKLSEAVDENGWWKLGDLGYMNESNDLFIVDRIKEMLKFNGAQVSPSELEELLELIPGVVSAGVAGKRGELGDILTAFILRAPDSKITENDIMNVMEKQNLHDSKKLRGGIIFVDHLPRNANGKLARRKLAEILNGTNTPKSVQ